MVQPPKESTGESCLTQINSLLVVWRLPTIKNQTKLQTKRIMKMVLTNEMFQTSKILGTGAKFLEDKNKPNNYMAEF